MSGQPDFGAANQYQPGTPSGGQWGPTPYSPYAYQPGSRPQRPLGCGWVTLILAILAGISLLCCGACGGFFLFGVEVVEGEIVASLNQDPIVRQHLGEVRSAELRIWDSIVEEMKHPTADDEASWDVFDVQGTKGSGCVIGKCVTKDDDTQELRDARLILPSGKEVKLSK